MHLRTMHLRVSIAHQTLDVLNASGQLTARYAISSGKKGVGEIRGSEQTPRGLHRIRAKIGAGQPINRVFVARRPTGEIWTPELAASFPGRDFILTRILWLCGCEPGKNRLGNVDTFRRFIYIHGTPDSEPIGQPASHGCLRMRNQDILELFPLVTVGCPVTIDEN